MKKNLHKAREGYESKPQREEEVILKRASVRERGKGDGGMGV